MSTSSLSWSKKSRTISCIEELRDKKSFSTKGVIEVLSNLLISEKNWNKVVRALPCDVEKEAAGRLNACQLMGVVRCLPFMGYLHLDENHLANDPRCTLGFPCRHSETSPEWFRNVPQYVISDKNRLQWTNRPEFGSLLY